MVFLFSVVVACDKRGIDVKYMFVHDRHDYGEYECCAHASFKIDAKTLGLLFSSSAPHCLRTNLLTDWSKKSRCHVSISGGRDRRIHSDWLAWFSRLIITATYGSGI